MQVVNPCRYILDLELLSFHMKFLPLTIGEKLKYGGRTKKLNVLNLEKNITDLCRLISSIEHALILGKNIL